MRPFIPAGDGLSPISKVELGLNLGLVQPTSLDQHALLAAISLLRNKDESCVDDMTNAVIESLKFTYDSNISKSSLITPALRSFFQKKPTVVAGGILNTVNLVKDNPLEGAPVNHVELKR